MQEYPQLANRDNPTQLSPTFQRIFDDCPDKVVGVLHAHWSKYKDQVNEPIKKTVSCMIVPYRRRDRTPSKMRLAKAYLPFPALIRACRSFAVDGMHPFLDLPSEITDQDLSRWEFLERFNVNKELNLEFYLRILRSFQKLEGGIAQEQIFKLYLLIQYQCVQSESYEAALTTVR